MNKWYAIVVAIFILGVLIYWTSEKSDVSEAVVVEEAKAVSSMTSIMEASNSDGSRKLTGRREVREQSAYYTFAVHDTVNDKEYILFEEVMDSQSSMVIPYNSWASDNKYVFLQTNTPTGMTYLVFKSDGSNFSDGQKYLDVNEYWVGTTADLVISRISGWAGPNLLVVYATRSDGVDGFAYWFDVESRRFMKVRER